MTTLKIITEAMRTHETDDPALWEAYCRQARAAYGADLDADVQTHASFAAFWLAAASGDTDEAQRHGRYVDGAGLIWEWEGRYYIARADSGRLYSITKDREGGTLYSGPVGEAAARYVSPQYGSYQAARKALWAEYGRPAADLVDEPHVVEAYSPQRGEWIDLATYPSREEAEREARRSGDALSARTRLRRAEA